MTNNDPSVWFQRYEQSVKRLFSELDKETDRGCVVLGASFLDDVVKSMVMHRLEKGGLAEKDIRFLVEKKGAPLQSFGVRIDYLNSVGVMDKSTKKALIEVASVRNQCAHLLESNYVPCERVDAIVKHIEVSDREALEKAAMEVVENGAAAGGTFYGTFVEGITHRGLQRVRFTLMVAHLLHKLLLVDGLNRILVREQDELAGRLPEKD